MDGGRAKEVSKGTVVGKAKVGLRKPEESQPGEQRSMWMSWGR